ncbi:3-isopropylmalate dehydrogenase [Candidatus Geothermarchaeota archaeon]|nr:MAG: 3-isopropylmalate dehydrogenase [Candidatus Geothermarchaeota archaeon]
MRGYVISLIPGDGIGPEQTKALLEVLKRITENLVPLEVKIVEAGDGALRKYGVALPEKTFKTIKSSHACVKGPVGESAADVIVKLRQVLDLYANVRPVRSYPRLPALRSDIDLVIVRENTEGLYKGLEYPVTSKVAIGIRVITHFASRRIAEYAFKLARKRRRKITAVHKANVLRETCGLFARTCREISRNYPDVLYEEQYVDACAANLIRRPHEFDVIVTTNMFGDILSDEAAQVAGGLGLAPAGNIGDEHAVFEPVHGAAFDIAGKWIANPISMILAASMMFEWLGEKFSDRSCLKAARSIKKAVEEVLKEGKVLTPDIGGSSGTMDLAAEISKRI